MESRWTPQVSPGLTGRLRQVVQKFQATRILAGELPYHGVGYRGTFHGSDLREGSK